MAALYRMGPLFHDGSPDSGPCLVWVQDLVFVDKPTCASVDADEWVETWKLDPELRLLRLPLLDADRPAGGVRF